MTIEIIDVEFKNQKKQIINKINLTLNPGIYGLFGANGSGKSILLKSISGQLDPSKGYIKIDNKLVFDNTNVMLKVLYLNEQFILMRQVYDKAIEYYLKIGKYIHELDIELAIKYLNEFQIPLNKSINKLSLGQRVCVIGIVGLATKRDVILLDGIYHGMDYHVRKEFNKKLNLKNDGNTTIIVATELKKEISVIIDYELNIKEQNIHLSEFEGELNDER